MTDLQKYINDALRTESSPEEIIVRDRHEFSAILCACIAAANLLDHHKKNIFYGRAIDPTKFASETNELKYAAEDIDRDTYLPLQQSLPPRPLDVDPRLLHAIIGIMTESGELISAVLKSLKSQQPIDRINVQEELGDLCWYIAIAVDALGADWDNILNTNIAKLRARYPEKFTEAAAIDRDLDTERKILEQGTPE